MARHKLLTELEVSEWLGIPEATLATQRFRPPKTVKPIPWLKMPNGDIRYREDQVNQWIEEASETPPPPAPRSRAPARRTG